VHFVCLLAVLPFSASSNLQKHPFKSVGDWVISQSPDDRRSGDFSFTRKAGGSSIVHQYQKSKSAESLKSRLKDYAAAQDSSDIVKMDWKGSTGSMHLVIRSISNNLVASFCGEGKSDFVLGTTYFPGSLTKESVGQIKSFYSFL